MRMIPAAIAAMARNGLGRKRAGADFPTRPLSGRDLSAGWSGRYRGTHIVAEHMRNARAAVRGREWVAPAAALASRRAARSAANGYTIGVGDIGAFGSTVPSTPCLTISWPTSSRSPAGHEPAAGAGRSTCRPRISRSWSRGSRTIMARSPRATSVRERCRICAGSTCSRPRASWTFVPYRGAAAALQD